MNDSGDVEKRLKVFKTPKNEAILTNDSSDQKFQRKQTLQSRWKELLESWGGVPNEM